MRPDHLTLIDKPPEQIGASSRVYKRVQRYLYAFRKQKFPHYLIPLSPENEAEIRRMQEGSDAGALTLKYTQSLLDLFLLDDGVRDAAGWYMDILDRVRGSRGRKEYEQEYLMENAVNPLKDKFKGELENLGKSKELVGPVQTYLILFERIVSCT